MKKKDEYGLMPKLIAQDPKITMNAKALYAYFCVHLDKNSNKTTLKLSRNKIIEEMGFGRAALDAGIKTLTDLGLIDINQTRTESGRYGSRRFALVARPERYSTVLKNDNSTIFDKYGIVPRYVIKDAKLSAGAKAIYAYLCTYAGSADDVFPTVTKITSEMKCSATTYQKYIREMLNFGLLQRTQVICDGRFSRNIYTIVRPQHKTEEVDGVKVTKTPASQNLIRRFTTIMTQADLPWMKKRSVKTQQPSSTKNPATEEPNTVNPANHYNTNSLYNTNPNYNTNVLCHTVTRRKSEIVSELKEQINYRFLTTFSIPSLKSVLDRVVNSFYNLVATTDHYVNIGNFFHTPVETARIWLNRVDFDTIITAVNSMQHTRCVTNPERYVYTTALYIASGLTAQWDYND